VLELYRALYPTALAAPLAQHPDRAMRFSNDCLYVREELVSSRKVSKMSDASVKAQLLESVERMKALGDWWYAENIEKQRDAVQRILARAEGFVDTADQDRFDECENVMSLVLRDVRSVAYQWKTTLARSKYYHALGLVVDAALTTVLDAVLALPDIPEVESQKLSELCRIFDALEGLFVDNPESDASSLVVAYVPSWLKFSYLQELLGASLVDISYLFDEGALIDFDVDELVKLVRALFSDTQLRTNTIAKLSRGHPVPAQQ